MFVQRTTNANPRAAHRSEARGATGERVSSGPMQLFASSMAIFAHLYAIRRSNKQPILWGGSPVGGSSGLGRAQVELPCRGYQLRQRPTTACPRIQARPAIARRLTCASLTATQPTPPPTTAMMNQSRQSRSNSLPGGPPCANPRLGFPNDCCCGAVDEADCIACSISCGLSPLDSRKAIRCASGDEAVVGSRRNEMADDTRAERELGDADMLGGLS